MIALPSIEETLHRTERHLESERLYGWDPYDALCSPVFRLPILRSAHLLRFGAQQVLKRSPWNPRLLLRIPKQLNPVSIGLYVQGQSLLAVADPVGAGVRRQKVRDAVQLLAETMSSGYSGACWGYPFDWEGRYASLPAGTPTVVATGIITNALASAHSVFGFDAARDLVLAATPFITHDLNRISGPEGSFCWSYSPLDRQAVLNATLKGSRLLAQAYALGGPPELPDLAARSVRFVIAHQRGSGAWPYSASDARSWADNFHTGYVLECLSAYRRHLGDRTADEALERGWRYYRDHFFTNDMTPKYYDCQVPPLDASACAQAIITLCEFGDTEGACHVADHTLRGLALADGSFAYQRRGQVVRQTPFLRWSSAWMYSALSRLAQALAASAGGAQQARDLERIGSMHATAASAQTSPSPERRGYSSKTSA